MAGTPHIAACRHNGIRAVLLAALALLATPGALAQNRDDAESAWRQAAQAAQAQRAERERRALRERRLRRISDIAHARMPDTLYASTPSRGDADVSCPVPVETRRRALREHRQALARNDAMRAFDRRAGAVRAVRPRRAAAGPPAASSAGLEPGHAAPATAAAAGGASRHLVPLFARASDPLRQGFARVVNRSDEAGEVSVLAVDDGGNRFGPVTLAVGAGATVHFNSADLESGNPGKGLSGGVGAPGEGDWRLELESSLDFEAHSYLRTRDGFLTAMHDLAPESGGTHRVPTFNPGSNDRQASLLRLVNAGAADVEAVVRGVDDRGAPGGEVRVAVPAGAARTLSAAQLESGAGPGVVAGALGDGAGKWRLAVTADGPIHAMSLLDSPTGTMTNLSTAPPRPAAGDPRRVPLFPPAADPFRQGFVRVANRSDEAGEVSVRASDDSGRDYEAVTLSVGADRTVHFNSDDLERGNPAKGLSAGVGAGEGDWRLALRSDLDIDVLAYVRTADGFLTSMHDLAPASGGEHLVATFNPGSNDRQASLLRLVNDGAAAASVTIAGVDDRGAPGRSAVSATVPAGRSLTLSAAQLESGEGSGIVGGALGDGAGKWRLAVASDRPVRAMSLLRSPTGHLANLSTAPNGAAGGTAAEFFAARVSPVVQAKCVNCHVEGGVSGSTRLVFVRSENADHLALNRQAFEDFLAEAEDGAELILNKIQGVAHGGGVQAAAGTEDYASIERYLELIGGESAAAALTPATLFDGVAMAPAWKTLWRAAIVFAGRLPTEAEYARAERGPAGLREAIRGVMEGPGFHDFLIRAANDGLLTDKHLGATIDGRADFGFVNLTNAGRALLVAGDEAAYWRWDEMNQFGFARAPLELIAHVAQNDLPYTEILTASYVMANPLADAAYGGGATFDDADDVLEFKPSRIVDYYRDDESVVTEYTEAFGLRVVDPGNLRTDWPHAGILNTVVFLKRYPTTPTNRNRARSRWTYYHFLGLDVEKSASRTTDPEALADTDNPTMRNPACTVCHRVLDPVAGAFQNYGVEGFYRDQHGGLDSLDDQYKSAAGYQEGMPLEGRNWTERMKAVWNLAVEPGDEVAIWPEEGFGGISLDRLDAFGPSGELVLRVEFEDLAVPIELSEGERHPCAEKPRNDATGKQDHMYVWGDRLGCAVWIELDLAAGGLHRLEVVGWSHTNDDPWRAENGVEHGKVALALERYREGDTWYRGMRTPGFDGSEVPDADYSLRWLAGRIVADERFAEAAVKFWWPAILGTEVAAPAEDEGDADFAGLLLASNAQSAETERLARGFRRGFGGGLPFNLKDLLAEIVLSKWARAESTADGDPVRLAALRDAGMERLLTPEELTSKTAAATGVELGRRLPDRQTGLPQPSHLRGDGVRLLYGGIDSDGVTERAGDMTATMAGVAQHHAAQLAGAIVLRELHLLPVRQRRLFRHVELATTPASEFGAAFEIEAASWGERETVSVRGRLAAGDSIARLSFTNDQWFSEDSDRNLRLDRLTVRDASGRVVDSHEVEDMDLGGLNCGTGRNQETGLEDHVNLCSNESVEVPFTIAAEGDYDVEAVVWADQAGDEFAELQILVESDAERSAGAAAIRRQLADLHRDLLGVAAEPDSTEVDEAFRLFVEVWRRKREAGEEGDICWPNHCRWWDDLRFFEGIDGAPSPVWVEGENGYDRWELGHETVGEWLDDKVADPNHVSRTWATVLAYLMTDHRYLYL